MADPKPAWIVCLDCGTEGLHEPFLAFADDAQAKAYVASINKFYGPSLRIVRAPFTVFQGGADG